MGFPSSSYTRWTLPGPHPIACQCSDDGKCDWRACRERDEADRRGQEEER